MQERREILVVGTIEDEAAREFLVELAEAEKDGWDALVKVSSRGGDLASAFAMHDALALFKKDAIVLATGQCQSAALLLLFAVPVARRYATENTIFLNHKVLNQDAVELPPVAPVMENLAKLREGFFGAKEAIEAEFIYGVWRGQ
jgi:ATP-dependent protease ClpP protease subunit